MFLSRLILEPRSRDVQRDLADCHRMHRRTMSAFPKVQPGERGRARFGVLYRVDGDGHWNSPVLYVQSLAEADWSGLPAGYLIPFSRVQNPASKSVAASYDALRDGLDLAFRLRANATKKISAQGRPNGVRVELRGDEAKIAWLARKAPSAGFALLEAAGHPRVLDVRVIPEAKLSGRQPLDGADGRRPLTFGSVLFEGRLRIVDAVLFRRALAAGIGPGKAFGFGLLSLAPTRSGS